jgi:general secretion pathway protein E
MRSFEVTLEASSVAREEALPELNKSELAVLEVLWGKGELSAREVHEGLADALDWAYSKTRTTLDRMASKGLLSKRSSHGIYLYEPLVTKAVNPAGREAEARGVGERQVPATSIRHPQSDIAKGTPPPADVLQHDDGAVRQPTASGSERSNQDLRAAASGQLARRLSPKYLEQHGILPLELSDGTLVVAAGGPLDPTTLDELSWTFGSRVKVVDAPAAEIHGAIMSAAGEALTDGQQDLRGADVEVVAEEQEAFDDVRALADQAPVIKLVNLMILEALKARASDLHLESAPDGLRVRHRIDGVLHDVSRPPRVYQAAAISRIKIMANLNIAERRLPQDGRIRLRLSEREVDLRVSTVPSIHGESVVLRILDRGGGVLDLAELGMPGHVLDMWAPLIRRPHGIILVTGPTGSGKTTTLYAALRSINEPGVKIITVEDPVEYQLEGITQIPVNRKAGLAFANALRSILRHDPDVLMVGEMRDPETAAIATQSALTGHVVFSTLHTNDAPGGLTRLVDMGIEPYLISATLEGIMAQRLVRVVCGECSEPYKPTASELAQFTGGDGERLATGNYTTAELGIPRRRKFRRGRGCDACSGSGYRGRTGIYELMPLTDAVRNQLVAGDPLIEIRRTARAQGMLPLRMDGYIKAVNGITTLEEVLRVTRDEATA